MYSRVEERRAQSASVEGTHLHAEYRTVAVASKGTPGVHQYTRHYTDLTCSVCTVATVAHEIVNIRR